MLSQILPEWDAHKRFEFMKEAVRSVISGLVGKSRKETKNEISELEKMLYEMHDLKSQTCTIHDYGEQVNKTSQIENAIHQTNSDLMILRGKLSKETTFRTRANWFDQGEKSNKYFLNLKFVTMLPTEDKKELNGK